MRPPRDIAADMVKAADAAIRDVWEREPKEARLWGRRRWIESTVLIFATST